MKLLLVEDDPDIQLVARAALKRAGFQVQVAGNGGAALEAVAAGRHYRGLEQPELGDAVVTDYLRGAALRLIDLMAER